MPAPLHTALLLTAVGVGLVLGVTTLLVALTYTLVALTGRAATPAPQVADSDAGRADRERAAAVAVAIALAAQQRAPTGAFAHHAPSMWQTVHRTAALRGRRHHR